MKQRPRPISREDVVRLIGLEEAAKLLTARRSEHPHVNTLRAWANPKVGCRPLGNDGPCIVLWTVRINGEILTLPEKVEEFERKRLLAGQQGGTPCLTT